MAKSMSIDEYMGDKGSGRGDFKSDRVKDAWKKNPGHLDFWLHRRAPFVKVWRHPWLRVVERVDRDTQQKTIELWGDQIVCFEDDETLQKQNFRDKHTRKRELPPTKCPTCRLLEWTWQMIHAGKMDWKQPIFRFDVPNAPPMIMRAGGILNLYSGPKVTDDQKVELKKAGIRIDEAFKQNVKAKAEYIYRVVEQASPNDGAKVMIVGAGLGKAVQDLIGKQRESLGADAGNPLKNPYMIRAKYDKSKPISDQYDALPIMQAKPSSVVLEAISSETIPSVERYVTRPKLAELRTKLEAAACVGLPWDAFFKGCVDAADEVAEQEQAREEEDGGGASFDFGHNVKSNGDGPGAAPTDPCIKCGYGLPVTESVCPECGEEYEVYDAPSGTFDSPEPSFGR